MTYDKFIIITNHLWEYREYLRFIEFDYPFYGGLKGKMGNCSPEAVDAMQNIWNEFQEGKFKTKKSFQNAYKQELLRLGEKIKHKNLTKEEYLRRLDMFY